MRLSNTYRTAYEVFGPKNFPEDKEKVTSLTVLADSESEQFKIYADQQEWHSYQCKSDVSVVKSIQCKGEGIRLGEDTPSVGMVMSILRRAAKTD